MNPRDQLDVFHEKNRSKKSRVSVPLRSYMGKRTVIEENSEAWRKNLSVSTNGPMEARLRTELHMTCLLLYLICLLLYDVTFFFAKCLVVLAMNKYSIYSQNNVLSIAYSKLCILRKVLNFYLNLNLKFIFRYMHLFSYWWVSVITDVLGKIFLP
jgi:hypothetical protein